MGLYFAAHLRLVNGCAGFFHRRLLSLTPFRYHCWRLIGWHLGIEDEFNVCASADEAESCMADYLEWTPQRLSTCRPSTHVLQRSVCDSFGRFTGLGTQWFCAMVVNMQTARDWNVPYTQITCLPGLPAVVRALIWSRASEVEGSGARVCLRECLYQLVLALCWLS